MESQVDLKTSWEDKQNVGIKAFTGKTVKISEITEPEKMKKGWIIKVKTEKLGDTDIQINKLFGIYRNEETSNFFIGTNSKLDKFMSDKGVNSRSPDGLIGVSVKIVQKENSDYLTFE